MRTVEPIRDKKKLETMKKVLKAQSLRDWLLFVLGINSGLRISDLLQLKVSNVYHQNRIRILVISREICLWLKSLGSFFKSVSM